MNNIEINPNFERDLACYTRMVNEIEKHGINFLGVDGMVLNFEKNGKILGHSLGTWQCVPDPTRPALTEELVTNWVIEAFKKYE